MRDNIPEIILANNQIPVCECLSDAEYFYSLKNKLKEEVEEFIADESNEELADIIEVVEALAKFKNTDLKEILFLKNKKAQKNGAFDKRIYLKEVYND